MSIFRTTEIPCPSCQTPVSFELVHSVNAGRRADLRQAILERTFQKQPCPSCGFAFRVEPELTYMDMGRGQFFAVWPGAKVAQWAEHEKRSQEAFDKAYGAAAPPEAQAIGKKLNARAVFGWPGLNEKLIAAEAGIDDHTLELAKVGVIRNLDEAPVAGNAELRLLGVEEENLVLGWIRGGTEDLMEVVTVPKAILAEIDAKPEAWQSLRDDLTGGPFVDYRRLLIGPTAAQPAGNGSPKKNAAKTKSARKGKK
jgi:endogenous inhibitor of DNA gyrase (YacG/DUF329 family)